MDVRSLNPPHLRMSDANVACVRGDYAAGGRSGEENPRLTKGSELPALLTAARHPCSVLRYTLLRSATMPMGRDLLISRATPNPPIPLVTDPRALLLLSASASFPPVIL